MTLRTTARLAASAVAVPLVLLVLGSTGPALGQPASVLAVLPEGVVLDAAAFPDLPPGARIGFRRPDGSTVLVGEGSVLDVREGRALIGLEPGSSVEPGDLAIRCGSLSGPGSQGELRASVQDLKTQLASTGGGPAEVQAAIAELESTLDAREAAIRGGACDVASHDQQIATHVLRLQQLLTASPASPETATPGSSPPGATTEQAASAGLPVAGTGAGSGTSVTESITAVLQAVTQLVQIGQSVGLIAGGGSAGAPQPAGASPPADPALPPQALLPTDPAPTPGASPSPPPPLRETPVPAAPSSPPSGASPTPTPPTRPPGRVGSVTPPLPPSSGSTPPGSTAPGGGGQPPAGRPPVVIRQPGVGQPGVGQSGSGQWWTVTQPRPVPPVGGGSGVAPGSPGTAPAPGGTATPGGATTPGGAIDPVKPPSFSLTPRPVLKPGATTSPDLGPVARVNPAPQRMATVRGVVRADNRSPVPGAVIVVGGKRVTADAEGVFLVGDVPLGREILMVTAPGFRPGRVAMDLASGETEKVTIVLRRVVGSPLDVPRSP